MSEKTIPEVLRVAADEIELKGLYRGDNPHLPVGGRRPTCASNAIMHAAPNDYIENAARETLAKHLGFGVETVPDCIFSWNDAQPDAATVIAALRSAATAAEEKP